MCASCLCTTDGCVERNAFAQARALSAPSCHIDLSFRRQRGETFFFPFSLLCLKFVRLSSNAGKQAKETESATKSRISCVFDRKHYGGTEKTCIFRAGSAGW